EQEPHPLGTPERVARRANTFRELPAPGYAVAVAFINYKNAGPGGPGSRRTRRDSRPHTCDSWRAADVATRNRLRNARSYNSRATSLVEVGEVDVASTASGH